MKKNHVMTVVLCCGLFNIASAQDMRNNSSRSLFADQKGARAGDAVTIIVVETSSASNDAKTSGSRESDLSFSASGKVSEKPLPNAAITLGTGNKFTGEGSTSSRGSVRAKISARVDSVLTNGNLLVNGSRTIVINGEEQIIRISGIVRPSDIQADNSVYSFNISDAVIVFEGSGIVARSQEPGWLTKIFHWLF